MSRRGTLGLQPGRRDGPDASDPDRRRRSFATAGIGRALRVRGPCDAHPWLSVSVSGYVRSRCPRMPDPRRQAFRRERPGFPGADGDPRRQAACRPHGGPWRHSDVGARHEGRRRRLPHQALPRAGHAGRGCGGAGTRPPASSRGRARRRCGGATRPVRRASSR